MSLLFTAAVADREKCPGDRARYQKAEGARRVDADRSRGGHFIRLNKD